jgi:HD-GYP domain-containing protein (c-di-GMP phosphodiesterase class II)
MTGESVICNDVQNDLRNLKNVNKKFLIPTELNTQTLICVPLKARDRTVGVLLAFNKITNITPKSSTHAWPDFYEEDRKILETLSHQVVIAIENSRLYTDLKRGFFDTVEALAEAIEKKDRYTGGHTKRVVYYSKCIAKYMDLSHEQLENVHLAAILHDVGKIGVEDSILKKQAPLTKEEWVVMKSHPEQGYDIMSRVSGLKDVIGGMRYHHERWDGKGYPIGLQGEEIPIIARIIAVADTYDAMVSTRPYRKGLDPQVAYDEIVLHSGSQFDPAVVKAFIEAFCHEKMGKGSGGSSFSNGD